MPVHTRRAGERRRHHRTGRPAGERCAAAIVGVTAEAEGLVDSAAVLDDLHFLRCQRRAASDRGGRLQEEVTDLLHASRLAGRLSGFHDVTEVGRLEQAQRQQRLNRDVGVRILGERVIVGVERPVPRFVERLARANRLDPHPGVGVLHLLADERGVERPETFERPHRVEAPDKRGQTWV